MPYSESTQSKRFLIVDSSGNERLITATRTVWFAGTIHGGLQGQSEWIYRTDDGTLVKVNWPDSSHCVLGLNARFTTIDPNATTDPLNGFRL